MTILSPIHPLLLPWKQRKKGPSQRESRGTCQEKKQKRREEAVRKALVQLGPNNYAHLFDTVIARVDAEVPESGSLTPYILDRIVQKCKKEADEEEAKSIAAAAASDSASGSSVTNEPPTDLISPDAASAAIPVVSPDKDTGTSHDSSDNAAPGLVVVTFSSPAAALAATSKVSANRRSGMVLLKTACALVVEKRGISRNPMMAIDSETNEKREVAHCTSELTSTWSVKKSQSILCLLSISRC